MQPHFSHPLGSNVSSDNDTVDSSFSPPHFVSASSPSLVFSRAQAVPAQHFPETAKLNFTSIAEEPFKSSSSVVVRIVNILTTLSVAG